MAETFWDYAVALPCGIDVEGRAWAEDGHLTHFTTPDDHQWEVMMRKPINERERVAQMVQRQIEHQYRHKIWDTRERESYSAPIRIGISGY